VISQVLIAPARLMIDVILSVSISLLTVALAIVFVNLRKTKAVRREYLEAKNVLSEIILSFNRDLQQQDERIRSISQRVDEVSSGTGLSKDLPSKDDVARIKNEIANYSNVSQDLSLRVMELSSKVEDVIRQQADNQKKISRLEEAMSGVAVAPDKIEAPIPIMKDRALAALTVTEMTVLEILANRGERTASQIQSEIGHTREHTARLMKSLHVRGYVERTTNRLPYVYRLNDSMMKILKKVETV